MLPSPPPSAAETRARLAAAVQAAPQDPRAYLRLALFDRDANNLPAAEQELRALWHKFPRFAEGPYQLGLLYLNLGQNDEALAPLQAAARLLPNQADPQVMAGLACFRLERYEEARRYV